MTTLEAENLIKQRWLDKWAEIYPSSAPPAVFDDEVAANADLWVRVSIQPNVREQGTAGRVARLNNIGRIFVQLFGPAGRGTEQLSILEANVRAVFELVRVGGVVIRAGSQARPSSDGVWAQLTLSFPYRYESQVTAQTA